MAALECNIAEATFNIVSQARAYATPPPASTRDQLNRWFLLRAAVDDVRRTALRRFAQHSVSGVVRCAEPPHRRRR